MIRVDLPSEQPEMLEKARRLRTTNLSERCLAVLLSDRGQSVPVIAESIGRHAHTIRSWLKAYIQDGTEGLRNTPPPGRANRKEHEALMILQPVLAKHPSAYGYLEAGWSTTLLVDDLLQQGLEASESTVKRALKRGGWVYKRVAKTMPAHAPSSEEKKRVDEIVPSIASKRDEQDLVTLFVDESHFSNAPYVQRGWLRAKAKRKGHPPKRRQSKTIFGALDLPSQRVYGKQAPKGNAGTFIAFLHPLHQNFPDQLLVLLLDHCSIHKSKKVKAFVAKAEWLELDHLAPDSPEYNPLERCWGWLQSKVYGCKSYKTMDGVISKIRQLIWHDHGGRLVATIRFNFSAYVEILSVFPHGRLSC